MTKILIKAGDVFVGQIVGVVVVKQVSGRDEALVFCLFVFFCFFFLFFFFFLGGGVQLVFMLFTHSIKIFQFDV